MDIKKLIAAIVSIAEVVVVMTPTDVDDKVVALLKQVLELNGSVKESQ